jgi:hypothetical protein
MDRTVSWYRSTVICTFAHQVRQVVEAVAVLAVPLRVEPSALVEHHGQPGIRKLREHSGDIYRLDSNTCRSKS